MRLQKGETAIPQPEISTRASSTQTPTKRRKIMQSRTVADLPPVKKMPRSKAFKVQNSKSGTVTKNKCVKCNKINMSKDDLVLREKVGEENWKWLGCDVEECQYWGHAKCLKLSLKGKSKKTIKNVLLLCPVHKAKK